MNELAIYFIISESKESSVLKDTISHNSRDYLALLLRNNIIITRDANEGLNTDLVSSLKGSGTVVVFSINELIYKNLLLYQDRLDKNLISESTDMYNAFMNIGDDSTIYDGLINYFVSKNTGNKSTMKLKEINRFHFDDNQDVEELISNIDSEYKDRKREIYNSLKNTEQYNESMVLHEEHEVVLPVDIMSFEDRKKWMYTRQQNYLSNIHV